MDLVISAISQGLLWSLLSLGIFNIRKLINKPNDNKLHNNPCDIAELTK